jgi:outer membrane protein TolC
MYSFLKHQQAGASIASIIFAVALTGCQSYQSAPLDSAAYTEKWHARSPSDENIREFASRIGTTALRQSSFNPDDGLTLSEGEVVALVNNADLRIARLKAGVAEATAEYAGKWDNPKLSLSILKVTESVPDPWVIGSALSLIIPVSGRLQIEKLRANAEAHSKLIMVAEEEWQALADLTKVWLEWSANRLRLEETEHVIASLNVILNTTEKLAEAGELPRTESTLFKVEQASRMADVAQLRGRVDEQEKEIRALMGLSPSASIQLIPSLDVLAPSESTKLEDSNPTLIRLQIEYEVAELSLRREIRRQYPDIQLGPQFAKDQGQSQIGLVGGIPIPIFNSNKGGIATVRAERELARANFEHALEKTHARLAVLNSRLEAVRSRRQLLNESLAPLVDQQLENARKLLEIGEGNSLILLESLIQAHETKLALIEARLEESVTISETRQLRGPASFPATTL